MLFLEGRGLPEVRPGGYHPRNLQGPHFRSAAATVENFRIGLAGPGTGRIRRKIWSRTPGTARNGPRFLG